MSHISPQEAINEVMGENIEQLKKHELNYNFTVEHGRFRVYLYGPIKYSDGREAYHGVVGEFNLSELPGCCAVMVSHGVELREALRGKGLGQMFITIREEIAKRSGYTYLMATTNQHNDRENHILEKRGFKRYEQFESVRTKNTVNVWMKKVA